MSEGITPYSIVRKYLKSQDACLLLDELQGIWGAPTYNPDRAKFASMALQGMLSNSEITKQNVVDISKTSVLIADELIKSLKKSDKD